MLASSSESRVFEVDNLLDTREKLLRSFSPVLGASCFGERSNDSASCRRRLDGLGFFPPIKGDLLIDGDSSNIGLGGGDGLMTARFRRRVDGDDHGDVRRNESLLSSGDSIF